MKGKVISVNISREKGTVKEAVESIEINELGIVGDAHAGPWHRQVSLLSAESLALLCEECGREFPPGLLAENLTTTGLNLKQVYLRDRFRIGAVELEITQIGKECHGDGCAIFRDVGKCIMPKQGIFTRVLSGGQIRPGDEIEHISCPRKILILTLSDRASQGVYEDKSGPTIKEALEAHFGGRPVQITTEIKVIPDDEAKLRHELISAIETGVDVVITTGGTGVGPRDITPDVVKPLLDKELPGVMEFIRVKYGQTMPAALLSRGVAGVAGTTLIYTLPGSVRAAREYTAEILLTLEHTFRMLWKIDSH